MSSAAKPRNVAYQGERGSFSELAASKFFGTQVQAMPFPTFREVFESVSKNKTQCGIVPFENSVYGSIHQNYDLLFEHKLYLAGEITLRIRLNLVGLPGVKVEEIRAVYSQAQALGQCDEFLRTMKGVNILPFNDTAGSARMIRETLRRDYAAVSSIAAARHHRLQILRKNIENDHQNFTRFVVISRRKPEPVSSGKTSLVFATRNIPGALFHALSSFALYKINLLKIESRPHRGRPWEYLFYLDVEENRYVKEALKHLREVSTFVRVLGTYPKGRVIKGS